MACDRCVELERRLAAVEEVVAGMERAVPVWLESPHYLAPSDAGTTAECRWCGAPLVFVVRTFWEVTR